MLKCPFCPFESETLSSLATHVRQKHPLTSCPICGLRYRSLPAHFGKLAKEDPYHAVLYCFYHKGGTAKPFRMYYEVAEKVLADGGFKVRRFVFGQDVVAVTPSSLILIPPTRFPISLPIDVAEEAIRWIRERGRVKLKDVVEMLRPWRYIESVHARVLVAFARSAYVECVFSLKPPVRRLEEVVK